MKKLVVFYSLRKNTKFIAEKFAEEIGTDILELKSEKEIPRTEPMQQTKGDASLLNKKLGVF